MVHIKRPPKLVYDESGRLVEVILSAEDYVSYLRSLAADEDWETLPDHLKDAIDRMLIDEVRSEKEKAFDLKTVLEGVTSEE